MKYAMVIIESAEEAEESEELSEAERDFDSLVRWWADLRARGKIIASARLAPPSTATSVSWRGQTPIVTDGPYLEAKEAVAGFAILDVDTEAEAMEIVSSLPARLGTRIEVRPVVEGRVVGS
jgi:hypothetical protein